MCWAHRSCRFVTGEFCEAGGTSFYGFQSLLMLSKKGTLTGDLKKRALHGSGKQRGGVVTRFACKGSTFIGSSLFLFASLERTAEQEQHIPRCAMLCMLAHIAVVAGGCKSSLSAVNLSVGWIKNQGFHCALVTALGLYGSFPHARECEGDQTQLTGDQITT